MFGRMVACDITGGRVNREQLASLVQAFSSIFLGEVTSKNENEV